MPDTSALSCALDEARAFAIRAHGNQLYNDGPYVNHLDDVVLILRQNGYRMNDPVVQAAYLHDVLEDTDVRVATIVGLFGMQVAQITVKVTDPSGENRAEKKAKLHALLADEKDQRVLDLKAADRLANLRTGIRTRNCKKLTMYVNEHAAFRAAAHRKGLNETVWGEIEGIINGFMDNKSHYCN